MSAAVREFKTRREADSSKGAAEEGGFSGSSQWKQEVVNWEERIAAVRAAVREFETRSEADSSEGAAEDGVESEKGEESEEGTEGEGSEEEWSQTEEEGSRKRKNKWLKEGEEKEEKGKGGLRKCNCTFWRDGTKVGTESPRVQAMLRGKEIELNIARKGREKAEKRRAKGAKENKRLKMELGDTQRWAKWGQEKLRRYQERARRQDDYQKRVVYHQEQIGKDLRKELEVLRVRKNKEIAEGKAQLVRKEKELEESREYYRNGMRNLSREVKQLQEENNAREEAHHQERETFYAHKEFEEEESLNRQRLAE